MPKFRKKPVVIDAILFDGANHDEVRDFLGVASLNQHNDGQIPIVTLEGTMMANAGDYIIRGIKGEYYPCKPDIFEATYELVQEA